jgi:hypothetical protein
MLLAKLTPRWSHPAGETHLSVAPCCWRATAVVLIDHPNTPRGILLDPRPNTVFLSVDDWYGLHERLRSTAAVITYVERAISSGIHPALGSELQRYSAHADADSRVAGGGHPMLPSRSLNAEEEQFAEFVDDLIDKVWPQDGSWPWTDPDDYRLIVEQLDRIPPTMRVDLGRKMWQTFLEVRRTGHRRSFYLAHSQFAGRFAFLYDVVSNVSSDTQLSRLVALTAVRQEEAVESGAPESPGTLGVGVLHDESHGRQYSFVFARGRPNPPPSVRWVVNDTFGTFDGYGIRAVPRPRRNDSCPCESGKKYKLCCGS